MIFASNQRWSGKISHETWWLTEAVEKKWGMIFVIRKSFVHRSRIEFATFSLFLGDVKNISGVSISLSTPCWKVNILNWESRLNNSWTALESGICTFTSCLFVPPEEGLYLCQWCGFLIFERLFPREMNRFIK